MDLPTEDGRRYDAEEQQLRHNFFSLSPNDLADLFDFMRDPVRQQEAMRLLLSRLNALDPAMAEAIDTCQQAVLHEGDPVSSFVAAYEVFETFIEDWPMISL